METLGPLLSIGIFGGGCAVAWFFFAKSKHPTTPARVGFGFLGIVVWFIGMVVINKIMPVDFERQMLRQMPDWQFSVGIWLVSAVATCLIGLATLRRSSDSPQQPPAQPTCPSCHATISSDASECPHCGKGIF